MNPNLPLTEALDEQERELARIVRALPGGEPPAALDAKILRAATNAAAASSRPGARWLASAASLWGIGGAAAAVLALGVSWQMIYGGPQPSGHAESAPAAAMSDAAEDEPVAVEFKQEQARESDRAVSISSPPPPAVTRSPSRRAFGRVDSPVPAPMAPAPPPAPEPQAFAEDALDEHVAARAEAQADHEGGANVGAMAAAAPAVTDSIERSAAAKSSAELGASAATTQAANSLARERRQRPLKPSNWLAEIRELRDAQRGAEAKASLLEFRKRYPDYVVPSDLAPLLRE